MRWLTGVVFVLAAGCVIAVASTDTRASDAAVNAPVWKAAFGCKLSNGHLVCNNTKNNKNTDTGNQGDTGKKKGKKNTDVGSDGERACPPGYVVLKEKNKYGAFCEPKEGFPAPAQAEAEKCKFGMIGTPPNDCECPKGTDFQGYKGCVKVQAQGPKPTPSNTGYHCEAHISEGGSFSYTMAPPLTEAAARAKFAQSAQSGGHVITGPVSCEPAIYPGL